MTTLLALTWAVVAATGAYLLLTDRLLWGRGPRPDNRTSERPSFLARQLTRLQQAGVSRLRVVEFVAVTVTLAVAGGILAVGVFGPGPVPVVVAVVTAVAPIAAIRGRRRARQEVAREAWPRMLEELRLQVVSLGRSIPQALFDVGARGPEEFHAAFSDARREWVATTDLERALAVLRDRLADATADAVCETLLIAHEVGGTDIDARLRALIDDRVQDLQGRKDARSKQAGVRFSRSFVLLVPGGMAIVGLLIGDGRAAYASPGGQLAVLVALGLLAGCWVWASRLLRLPEERRVFASGADP